MLHWFGFSEYHHIHKMTSRKSTVFMFFGIIIGLCFGILFKNYRALELVKKCSLRPNTGNRKKTSTKFFFFINKTIIFKISFFEGNDTFSRV